MTTSIIKVNVPGKTRPVKLFQGTSKRISKSVYSALKDNPFSVNLPDQYLYDVVENRIKSRDTFLKSGTTEFKERYQDYFVSGSAVMPSVEGEDDNYAFANYIQFKKITNTHLKGMAGFDLAKNFVLDVENALKTHQGIEFNLATNLQMDKTIDGQPTQSVQDIWVGSPKKVFNRSMTKTQIKQAIGEMVNNIKGGISELEGRGSGLKLVKVDKFFMNTIRYVPLSGGTYVKTPKYISNKKATINPLNNGKECPMCEEDKCQHCFIWAVMVGIRNETVKGSIVGDLKYYRSHLDNTLDYSMLKFPVDVNSNSIRKFEEKNNLRINILSCSEDQKPFSIRLSKHNDDPERKTITLLLVNTEETKHYVYVKSLSRLVGCEMSNHKTASNICQYCFNSKSSKKLLLEHENHCRELGTTSRIKMPRDGEKVKFKSACKAYPAPITAFCDFESFSSKPEFFCKRCDKAMFSELEKHNHERCCAVKQGESVNTNPYNRQVANSWFFYLVCSEPEVDVSRFSKRYYGKDCVAKLIEHIEWVDKEVCGYSEMGDDGNKVYHDGILQERRSVYDIKMSLKQVKYHAKSKQCEQCGTTFSKTVKYRKVRDHCHLTGKYRGALCNTCNINQHHRFFDIKVFFHNLKGYDAHLIIKEASRFSDDVEVTAQNSEKYISFKHKHMRFLDSFQFLTASLDQLVKNLVPKDVTEMPQRFPHLFSHFRKKGYNDQTIAMLCRKGVYPYDHVSNHEVLLETELPPIEKFRSHLYESDCSPTEHYYAQQVWKAFGCQTLMDYHNIYLECDVLLLTDVFQAFRKVATETYGIDPCHAWTLPGYSWECGLKMTGQELTLVHDQEVMYMWERMKRGGTSMIGHRYGKANNPYLDDYDKDSPTSYIMYVDANNLYGGAMCESLPTDGGSFFTEFQETQEWVDQICAETEKGYILEVDMDYPAEIHDLHCSYPLAVESMAVTEEMLSPTMAAMMKAVGRKLSGEPKLIPNLYDKKNYVLHSRLLQFYLKHGLVLKKIHKVIQFNQKPWIKPYIEKNTEKRKNAANDFEKDLYKLQSNAFFGRTMMNVRNQADFELVKKKERLEKIVRTQRHKDNGFHYYSENLVGVDKHRPTVTLNKPTFVGMCILDLAKLHMYKHHYEYVLPKYGHEKVKLLMTDTDSLCYQIETEDIYKDMIEDKDRFDLSNCDPDGPLYDATNKKVVYKFKSETGSDVIREFVGLGAKMYSMSVQSDEEKNRQKHTGKGIVRYRLKQISHQEYKDCIFDCKIKMVDMNRMRTRDHTIDTVTLTKVGLCPVDDKTYVLPDTFSSLKYGHYKIAQSK